MQHRQNKPNVEFKNITGGRSFEINTIQQSGRDTACENAMARRCSHFQIIWITKGKGSFWIDLRKCDFQNNHLFFMKPGQVYSFQSENQLEGYNISFTESFLGIEHQESDSTYHSSLFQIFAKPNGMLISNDALPEMKDFADKMINEYNNFHLFRNEMLQRYLKILFIYLTRQVDGVLHTTRQTRNIELVQKFMSLLEKNFKTEKMVSGYAGMLLVTPNYLNEIIKKTTGYSAGYHIRQRIVLEAKRQATYSDTCMKQIGYCLGFNDMAHFSKFFKSATGMSFTDFKKEKMIIASIS